MATLWVARMIYSLRLATGRPYLGKTDNVPQGCQVLLNFGIYHLAVKEMSMKFEVIAEI